MKVSEWKMGRKKIEADTNTHTYTQENAYCVASDMALIVARTKATHLFTRFANFRSSQFVSHVYR